MNPLDGIKPQRLKEVVAALPLSGTFTEPQFCGILSDITGETFISLSASVCVELQNLIDLTRLHLFREAEDSARREQRASTPGRPARIIPAEKWKVSIRQDLTVFLDLYLLDPVRGKVQLGARSALVEELLLEWARKRGFKS